jgi:flagellar motor switch protein FliN/FliY
MIPVRPTDTAGAQRWLRHEWSGHFRAALDSMCPGATPASVQQAGQSESAGPLSEPLCWTQPFSLAPDAPLIVSAGREVWSMIGASVLASAGIEDASPEDARSTYLEILQQALSALASSLTALLGKEVTCLPGQASPPPADPGIAGRFSTAGLPALDIFLALPPAFLTALLPPEPAAPGPVRPQSTDVASAPPPAIAPSSSTIELLYDVELPVSVSFGRAHLQLKEILKLTTGSIVELNRTVAEPVELIVNNCVIARGEVVVVEGNYGVRIQQILSQKERLRTLH